MLLAFSQFQLNYLRNSQIFGWGVVYPIKNEDGSINWFNLLTGGSWIRLLMLVVFIAILLFAIAEYAGNAEALILCKQTLEAQNILRIPYLS